MFEAIYPPRTKVVYSDTQMNDNLAPPVSLIPLRPNHLGLVSPKCRVGKCIHFYSYSSYNLKIMNQEMRADQSRQHNQG